MTEAELAKRIRELDEVDRQELAHWAKMLRDDPTGQIEGRDAADVIANIMLGV